MSKKRPKHKYGVLCPLQISPSCGSYTQKIQLWGLPFEKSLWRWAWSCVSAHICALAGQGEKLCLPFLHWQDSSFHPGADFPKPCSGCAWKTCTHVLLIPSSWTQTFLGLRRGLQGMITKGLFLYKSQLKIGNDVDSHGRFSSSKQYFNLILILVPWGGKDGVLMWGSVCVCLHVFVYPSTFTPTCCFLSPCTNFSKKVTFW